MRIVTSDATETGAVRRAAGRAETRARILASARELIPGAEASLPVTAIAKHAGVAIQTIYDQFGSKGGLLIAVINDVQRSAGLFETFRDVFTAPDGEAAMRRMIEATIAFWDRAWPYLEFVLRTRRIDGVVAREMDFVDRLRYAHFWAITRRLEEEGRLRAGQTADTAADRFFALTIPTIYEELVVVRKSSVGDAIEAVTAAVRGAILEPGAPVAPVGPPDWAMLERAAASRAKEGGADPDRLSPSWLGTGGDSVPGRGGSR
jgi:AcrR family transcriptional regulator